PRSLPAAAPGLFEIWPLMRPQERREIEGWDAPFDALSLTSPQVRLAERIARTNGGWIPQGGTRRARGAAHTAGGEGRWGRATCWCWCASAVPCSRRSSGR